MPYNPSDNIIEYIKKQEGFANKWYKDINGIATIGYGFAETPELKKKYPSEITKEQANAEFLKVARRFADKLKEITPNFDKLNQNQKDALFSYLYNIGEGGYTKKSPKLQEGLRELDFQKITANIDFGYKQARGLKNRRDYERQLFNTPV